MHKFKKPLIFISYTNDDKLIAEALKQEIDNVFAKGVEAFVFSVEGLKPGDDFIIKIKEKLMNADVFIPLISLSSLNRPWVWAEIGGAYFNQENLARIYPIIMPGVNRAKIPEFLNNYNSVNIEKIESVRSLFKDLCDQFEFGNVIDKTGEQILERAELYKNMDSQNAIANASCPARKPFLCEEKNENPFFKRFAERLNAYDELNKRCSKVTPLKKAIARFFWQEYLTVIIKDNGVRTLFFESGSSIAFVADEFLTCFEDEVLLKSLSDDLKVQTNNILVFLDFALPDRTHIHDIHINDLLLYPFSRPDDKYGATFGNLLRASRRPWPRKAFQIPKDALSEVMKIKDHFDKFNKNKKGIIFMAASGIDLNSEDFSGPHVGSYYNMLFKRAILESECPAVMFLDEDKLPKPFREGDCYPVCDKQGLASWKSVRDNKPLAIAIAVSSDKNATERENYLKSLGFSYDLKKNCDPCSGITTLIAANELFSNYW